MKICLATLHHNPDFTPLSLLYLKAYLVERHGCRSEDVVILEFPPHTDAAEIERQILDTSPDVVGLSCYVWNIVTLMQVAARLKASRPRLKIVLGGPEVGPVAIDVLSAHPAVDVVVKSEGEIPFAELADAWSSGGAIDGVKGICFRQGASVVANEDAPELRDVNHLASPHLVEFANPLQRIICIETQRGCVFRCNFCFYNKDLSIRNRRFDLDRVTSEIAFWLRQGVASIYLMDPIFNLNAQRAKTICRFIRDNNPGRVSIHAEVWAEFIDEELAQLMRDANFQFVEVGLQSTDDTALATVERRLKVQRFVDGVEQLKRFRIPFELQLIYGLPGETLATFRKSLNFAASLDPPALAVFPLMVLPGTELWRKARDLRLEYDPEPPYVVRSHFSMTAADIAYGDRIVAGLKCMGDSRTIRLLARERGVSFSDIVDEWIAWREEQAWPEEVEPNPKLFVAHFCEKNHIPPDFYRGLASWEFSG
jgi:radical SAM superfamily enzyme YgiQ (UPF0313 family)